MLIREAGSSVIIKSTVLISWLGQYEGVTVLAGWLNKGCWYLVLLKPVHVNVMDSFVFNYLFLHLFIYLCILMSFSVLHNSDCGLKKQNSMFLFIWNCNAALINLWYSWSQRKRVAFSSQAILGNRTRAADVKVSPHYWCSFCLSRDMSNILTYPAFTLTWLHLKLEYNLAAQTTLLQPGSRHLFYVNGIKV